MKQPCSATPPRLYPHLMFALEGRVTNTRQDCVPYLWCFKRESTWGNAPTHCFRLWQESTPTPQQLQPPTPKRLQYLEEKELLIIFVFHISHLYGDGTPVFHLLQSYLEHGVDCNQNRCSFFFFYLQHLAALSSPFLTHLRFFCLTQCCLCMSMGVITCDERSYRQVKSTQEAEGQHLWVTVPPPCSFFFLFLWFFALCISTLLWHRRPITWPSGVTLVTPRNNPSTDCDWIVCMLFSWSSF